MKFPLMYRPLFLFDADDGAGSGGADPAHAGTDAGDENGAPGAAGGSGGTESEAGKPAPSQAVVDKAYATARKLEAENKKLREEKEALEAKEKSDLENAQDRIAKLEKEREADAAKLRRSTLIRKLGKKELGVAEDAVELVAGVLDIEYDEDDNPIGLEEAVEAFLEEHPSLRAKSGGSNGNGSPANPAGGRGGKAKAMTPADLKKLAKDDPVRFNAMWEAGDIPDSALSE